VSKLSNREAETEEEVGKWGRSMEWDGRNDR